VNLPPLGLYVHLPWCERKCPYCDFNSHETAALPEMAYVDALLTDLAQDAGLAQGRAVDTVFIGGGTPSLFSPAAIERLLQRVAELVALAPGFEATMEANPGSAEANRFAGYRQAGVNRLSLGIQSFDDACLASLGRIHDSQQAHRAIEAARGAGFDSFNIDLMHGLPGQTAEHGLADVVAAIACDPPHLSWYQLTIEPNTVFHKRPPRLPLEDTLADIQEGGEELLAAAGYVQYEVSAYSRPGQQCRHNLNYWTFGDYLAIGAGAHGKVTGPDGRIRRYAKTRAPQDYLDSAGRFTASERWLDEQDRVAEFMLFALRLNDGFDLATFEQRTGVTRTGVTGTIAQLIDEGLLEAHAQRIRASALGRRFLDDVVARFLPAD
jgi:oxygen-independent coproporphyrinogen-3 oxidase